ncbi:hypothetical protein TcG_12027 [Trypanosoma cruzi]|nr:hypothetical protein TcG_12027 [Trypanosoma cruzi]
MCPHTVDGQEDAAAVWAGGRQSAARWSTRSRGAHVGKRFRRRQRRAGHRSQGGKAPPTQRVPCDPQGACRPVEEWAGVASRLCAVSPLGAGCSCNTLGLLHSVRPDKCGNFTAAARTVPRCVSNRVVTAARDVSHTPRCKHSSQLHAGQGQHVSVVAACLSVAGGRPPSPQCGMADGDPSPCKQVDVQWDTRSTRCAVTSGNKTRRPLIRAAYAGSSDSSDSMPIGVAARSSPAAVDGERPSRSS